MRVMEAWIQGFTGEGVTVGIVDDGKSKSLWHIILLHTHNATLESMLLTIELFDFL